MPNKAIHQLTYTQDRDDVNDRFYMVRSATDYQLPGTALPPKLNVASRLLTDTQVLALYTTPLEIVAAPATGYIHIPVRGLVEFSGGSADYATNTVLYIGSTSAMGTQLIASIADRTDPNALTLANDGSSSIPAIEGDSLSVSVLVGNPTAGDSDILVTVWYYTIEA
jgi:hypothetical protein